MKKLIVGLLPLALFTFSIASAWIIKQNDVLSLSTCNPAESLDRYYYISSDSWVTVYPYDTYWNTNDVFINKSVSSIEIWRHWVISQCSDWDRTSNFVRWWNKNQHLALIFNNDDGCVLNKPNYTKTNNPTAIDAQIHYTVGFNLIWWGTWPGKATNTGKFYYQAVWSDKFTCYPNWNQVSSNSECDQSSANYWTEPDYHTWECLNYRVFRCGDGLVNGPSGSTYDNGNFTEQCDPKAPGWTESTCDPVTCQPIWKLKITKTLSTARKVTQVWEEVKWIIKVTAENGDVKDFVLTDKLPEILDYVRFREISNPSNLKLPNPPHLNNGLITWNVEWTLKSGQSLEIELVTKANKMPTQDETNWACVEPKGNTDPTNKKCDDDYITWDKGKLEIKKVLSWAHNQVENTGDIVTWNITVKAVGADVTNFTLKDHLPKVLDYEGVRIVNNPSNLEMWQANVTQTSTWTNITWEVKWTLKKDQTFEIELISKANAMPQQKETNVACVKWEKTDPNPDDPDDPDDDCDDDYITWNPKVWLKKAFSDWTKNKTVRIWDLITYKITFGNSGGADAAITAIKDFLPKNVEYVSSEIYVNGNKIHTNLASWSEVINSSTKVDGVYVDIFTWMTLKPGDTWYILLTGKVLSEHQDSRTNFACIYVNDEKIECDDARHDISELMCKLPSITKKSFTSAGWSTDIVCSVDPDWEKANTIELDCGTWAVLSWTTTNILTWANIESLSGTCVYPSNSSSSTKTYTVQCKVNGKSTNSTGACADKVTVDGRWGWGWSPLCKNVTVNPATGTTQKRTVTCETNYSSGSVESIEIYCDYKNNKTTPAKTGSKVSSLTGECTYTSNGTYEVQCVVNWKVENSCKTEAKKSSSWSSWCFPEWTKVTMADWTSKNIEEVQVWDVVLSYNTTTNTNEKNVVKRQIVHTNHSHEMYELTINGEVLKVTDVHPFYVRKSVSSNDYSWVEAKDLKVWNILLMTDGNLVKIENITHYANLETVYNLEVEGNHNYFVDKWYLVHNKWWTPTTKTCTLEDGSRSSNPLCSFANPVCFNVNEWNVSIEKWEILPFYFNIYNNKKQQDTYNFTVYEPSKYPLWKINSYNWIKSDTWKCKEWDIALNSLKCTYKIIDGKDNDVYTKTVPCLDDGSNLKQWGLVNAWFNWQKLEYGNLQSTSNNGYTFTTNVYTTNSSDWNTKYFWEYQFQLTKVEYLQCDANGKWQADDVTAVCQSNFVLTNSYTVQKTPSGNFTNTSTNQLKNYLYADGKSTMDKSTMDGLLNKIAWTSDYAPNKAVETAMTNFITKYQKLAVKVNTNGSSFLNGKSVKKVPWKNIYFVDGDITINWTTKAITTPFTIVQTSWKTTIKWNVNHNMMLLTKWSIVFKWNCTSNQTVKWIFYAANWLSRQGVWKNDNVNNSVWCDKWWLHVKWVLIGSWLDKLMKGSRSNLSGWFNTTNKTQTVMNWASVLIEYSPSIFTKSTMPPGAEDFTTALTVYKN